MKSRQDIAKLSVAVSGLVQVHEIHVDLIVGQLLVCLGMKVKKRLSQLLKTLDPHFCRREGVHPGDDADTFIVVHNLSHILYAGLRGDNRRKKFDPDGILQLIIQKIRHFSSVCRHFLQAFITVKILAANDKI